LIGTAERGGKEPLPQRPAYFGEFFAAIRKSDRDFYVPVRVIGDEFVEADILQQVGAHSGHVTIAA